MKKKLILVAAPPACGKNYVSERICQALDCVAYLDKDDLSELLRRCFTLCSEECDMDGEFYAQNLRPYEYKTLLRLAFSALQFEKLVLVNAPLSKEVRSEEFMRGLRDKANGLGAELVLIWVTAPIEICHKRMRERNCDRDRLKLAQWEEYVKKIDYSAPVCLKEKGAIDEFILFNNENEQTFLSSLQQTLTILKA